MKHLLIVIACILFALSTGQAQVINRATSVNKVKVFPNPATNVINVLGLKNTNRAEITITDQYGNTQIKHSWAISNKAVNIPVNTLQTGLYFIFIRSTEQNIKTKFYKK